jgi:hypothetical protein
MSTLYETTITIKVAALPDKDTAINRAAAIGVVITKALSSAGLLDNDTLISSEPIVAYDETTGEDVPA